MGIETFTPFSYPLTCLSTALPSSPVAGQRVYVTDLGQEWLYNGSVWVCTTPMSAQVYVAEATASAVYVNLATVGPAVTIQTGTKALVIWGADVSNPGSGGNGSMSFAVSGASSIAASDTYSFYMTGVSNLGLSGSYLIAGLTPGLNTFTAKYKTSASTSFWLRWLTAVGIP